MEVERDGGRYVAWLTHEEGQPVSAPIAGSEGALRFLNRLSMVDEMEHDKTRGRRRIAYIPVLCLCNDDGRRSKKVVQAVLVHLNNMGPHTGDVVGHSTGGVLVRIGDHGEYERRMKRVAYSTDGLTDGLSPSVVGGGGHHTGRGRPVRW